MGICVVVGTAVSVVVAVIRIPQGQRGAFISRVYKDVVVALFFSIWLSVLLAAIIFMVFAVLALLLPPTERKLVLWLFPGIWAVCYVVFAFVRVRNVFRDALAPDDRPSRSTEPSDVTA